MISIKKLNQVYIKIDCDPSIAYELNEYFTFNVPNAKFSPAYKNKLWDGKIRLFHLRGRTIYAGLRYAVENFGRDRDYHVEYTNPNEFAENPFSTEDAEAFINKLNLPVSPREYQLDAFIHAIRRDRGLLVSPTGSGKSLIIYMISAYYARQKLRTLIVVPTTGLIHQMVSDFCDYGCPETALSKIYSGQEKITDTPFTVTTWQSVYKLPEKWFDQWDVIIGDEAHLFKAKSLTTLMEKAKCKYRFGLTGTLDGTHTNKLVLEGLFGPVKQITTTKELIQEKTLAQLKIKAIVLSYDDSIRQQFARNRIKYKDELRYLIINQHRTSFIANLTSSLKENTLLLFNHINHGRILFDTIQQNDLTREVFFVYGGVEGEERDQIRKYVEQGRDVIVVASYKTFSTGVNIKNLHNIIFGSPSKSRVRVFQSIGRGLRTNQEKTQATLYDIADDISWKSYKNNTIQHFAERIQMYNQESFDYKIYNIQLKGTI